jgi:hypothetical protein
MPNESHSPVINCKWIFGQIMPHFASKMLQGQQCMYYVSQVTNRPSSILEWDYNNGIYVVRVLTHITKQEANYNTTVNIVVNTSIFRLYCSLGEIYHTNGYPMIQLETRYFLPCIDGVCGMDLYIYYPQGFSIKPRNIYHIKHKTPVMSLTNTIIINMNSMSIGQLHLRVPQFTKELAWVHYYDD